MKMEAAKDKTPAEMTIAASSEWALNPVELEERLLRD